VERALGDRGTMKEADIRPRQLFNRYLELVEHDAGVLLADRADFVAVACPACDGEGAESFVKHGYQYAECRACGSLFLNPRPTGERMHRFYAEAESVRFWSSEFYRATAESRREAIFRPRARMIAETADRFGVPPRARLADVGAGYGLFLEEASAIGRFADPLAIEPAESLAAVCRDKGFQVIGKTAEAVAAGEVAADVVTAFEVIEHVNEPLTFLAAVARLTAPRGIAVLTTLTASGFDIQVLWDAAKCVHPPHHINLMTTQGLTRLVGRAGLELIELTTPGRLDVDIVANTLDERPDLPVGRFVSGLLASPSSTRSEFQNFLASNRLSSHVCIVVRRPG
jgi:2-polyprenyl-3-methyl-5-hydroxy-6-metoxy-1,4-benzoquinol methylase